MDRNGPEGRGEERTGKERIFFNAFNWFVTKRKHQVERNREEWTGADRRGGEWTGMDGTGKDRTGKERIFF